MKGIKVEYSECALVTFQNQDGVTCFVTLTRRKSGEWRDITGTFLKQAPGGAMLPHALPHDWEPPRRMVAAIERSK